MQRLILKPLESEYNVLSIRTTNLESYDVCGYYFKYSEWYSPSDPQKIIDNQRGLQLGNILHEVLQSHATNKQLTGSFYPLIDQQLHQMYEGKEYELATSMIETAIWNMDWYYDNKIYNPIATEIKLYLEIEVWKTLVILTGSADVLSEVGWMYEIIDFKTSKVEYGLDDVMNKIQRYVYSYLLANIFWRDKYKWFSYLVWTKHLRWSRHQRTPIYLTQEYKWEPCPRDRMIKWECQPYYVQVSQEEIVNYVEDLITRYVDSYNTNTRPATPHKEKIVGDTIVDIETKNCMRCNLRKEGKCPAFAQPKTSTVLDEIF